MKKGIVFPIKGTFYYAADLAIEQSRLSSNQPLTFKLEPNNPYDKHAIQIWLAHNSHTACEQGLLLGYVPRLLAKTLCKRVQHQQVLALKVTRYAQLGKHIEIDCYTLVDQAWLSYAVLLIQAKTVMSFTRLKRFKQRLFNKPPSTQPPT